MSSGTPTFSNQPSAERPLFGLVFEAKVGDATLRGVDDADRISSFTVALRPAEALMAQRRQA
jgi:hypothetical protein